MIRRAGFALLLAFCVAAAVIAAFAATEAGTRFLLARAAALAPGEISWQDARGTLIRGIAMDGISWREGERGLDLSQASVRIDGLALLGGRIVLHDLTLSGLRWRDGGGEPAAGEALTTSPLPDISLRNFSAEDIRLDIGGRETAIDRIALDARLSRGNLIAHNLAVALPGEVAARGDGRISLAPPHALDARIAWSAPTPEPLRPMGAKMSGSALISGDIESIGIENTLNEPFRAESSGDLRPAGEATTLDLLHRWQGLAWSDDRLPPIESREGRLLTRGRADDLALELDARLSVPGRPELTARGAARWRGGTLDIDSFTLAGEPGEIGLSGRIGETSDLSFSIDLGRLDALAPGLEGRIAAVGTLRGPASAPAITARIDGTGLALAGHGAERLSADIAADMAEADGAFTVAIHVAGLMIGERPVDSLSIEIDGSPGDHRGEIVIASDDLNLAASLSGGLRESRWQGRIAHLAVEAPHPVGRWVLGAPAGLAVGRDDLALAESCLDQNGARLCFTAASDDTGSQADLRLTGLSIGRFIPTQSPVRVETEVAAEGTLRRVGTEWSAEIAARAGPGQAILLLEGGPEEIAWQDAELHAGLEDGIWTLAASLGLPGIGQAEGSAVIGPPDDEEARPVTGTLRAGLSDLRLLEAFVPQLQAPEGRIDAALTVSGTLADPAFGGRLTLSDGSALLPDLGIRLQDAEIVAEGDGEALHIAASARSGGGELRAEGRLTAQGGLPALDLHVVGEAFEAARLPDLRVVADADLHLTLAGRDATLSGRVAIPEADIVVRDRGPQAVAVSGDEIIEGVTDAPPRWTIHSRVTATLGEAVHLQGYGLDTRLTGSVLIEDDPGRDTRIQGEIALANGRYSTFGQTLTIERSRIAFLGPPDNPALDIRAVRRVGEITAGIEIGGTLHAPQSRIFSIPPMPESDAMSYLLTGRPLGDASEADIGMLLQAIGSFGIDRTSAAAQDVARAGGLDEFAITGTGEFDQTGLLLGKHISSRLYVRYVIGLFEAGSTLLLRYRLSDSLTLETLSGEQQSVDLIYRKER